MHKVQLLARWASPVILRYADEAPRKGACTGRAAFLTPRTKLYTRVCRVSDHAASHEAAIRAPRVRALERQLNPDYVRNAKAGVVHMVLTGGSHVPPHAWTTCCGWRFWLTQYEVHRTGASFTKRCALSSLLTKLPYLMTTRRDG
eukprot:3125237-Amphidinium_carterae.2